MNIQKNFSTTLRRLREIRGMSMREFSEELGIALSSLEEYEAGRRLPRGDTLVLIADKLHIPLASLISDLPSADPSLQMCLDCAEPLIQALHPYARASAQCALALLRSSIRISDEQFFLESRAAPPENPSARFRYKLHESRGICPSTPSYGILVEELLDGNYSTSAAFAPFSDDRILALQIAFTANELQLPPSQFFSEVFPNFFPLP